MIQKRNLREQYLLSARRVFARGGILSLYTHVLHGDACVTRRKLQRPGTAKEHRNTTKQRKATVNPYDRRQVSLSDHAPDSAAESTHESSRIIATNTATLHARQMHLASTTQIQQSRLQSHVCKRNPVRGASGTCRSTTQTPPATAGTRGTPLPGGPAIMRNWWAIMSSYHGVR